MRRANDRELERILPYLKNNVKDCIYMYIDIAKYGVHNDFLDVWINDGPEIDCVCMRYHTGFSVYTERENWPVDDVIRLIGEYDIRSITARRDIVRFEKKRRRPTLSGDDKTRFFHPFLPFTTSGECVALPVFSLSRVDRGSAAERVIFRSSVRCHSPVEEEECRPPPPSPRKARL